MVLGNSLATSHRRRYILSVAVIVLLTVAVMLYLLGAFLASSSFTRPLFAQSALESDVSSPIAALTTAATTAATSSSSSPLTLYTLKADGISASFISYGARLTSLMVPGRTGEPRDVVVGYDDPAQYAMDSESKHTYFGSVVGRYANRIRNGSFSLDGTTYKVPANEHGGANTLHGGWMGYDQRNWTVTAHSNTSITFTLLDKGFESFPGTVLTHTTYSVGSSAPGASGERRPRLTTRTVSVALDEKTPIMLAHHFYWNLGSFTTPKILDDQVLWMPYSDRYIEVDSILVPTGNIETVASKPVLDFTSPKAIGEDFKSAADLCGHGCTGYDNAFILDRPREIGAEAAIIPVLSLWSITTGIRMDVSTNQKGMQIYTCNGLDGTIPVKPSQVARNSDVFGGGTKFVEQYGCLAIEPQSLIDSINHPAWGNGGDSVYSPETGPAVNYATYDFSVIGEGPLTGGR
jgi:aldose 1-epimerase